MKIALPNVPETIDRLMSLETSFDERSQTIRQWVKEHQEAIRTNNALVEAQSDVSDLKILRIFLSDLLVRNIGGESGSRIHEALSQRSRFIESRRSTSNE